MRYNTINCMHTPLCLLCLFFFFFSPLARDRTDVINGSLFTLYKAQIQWKHFQCFCMKSPTPSPPSPTAAPQSRASAPPSLMVPSPISHHSALLSACPLVMAVPRYNSPPPPPPLIWHTVMQILGSTRISGDRSFARSRSLSPDCSAIGSPGLE